MAISHTQYTYFKLLGYEATTEESAVLKHPDIPGYEGYIWKRDNFREVMAAFPERYKKGFIRRMAMNLVEML